jgi:hypothetical protein
MPRSSLEFEPSPKETTARTSERKGRLFGGRSHQPLRELSNLTERVRFTE